MVKALTFGFRLSICLFIIATLWANYPIAPYRQLQAQEQPITDPVPQSVPDRGLRVQISRWLTMPPTASTAPLARISFITYANDNQNRFFANDLRGVLYVIKHDKVTLYLNLKAQFPDFVDTPGLGMGFAFFALHPDFINNGKFYTVHSEAGNALKNKTPDYLPSATVLFHGVLTEWTTNTPTADQFSATGTKREVLRIGFPSRFHNFQQIAFHPQQQIGSPDYGMLYISLGDGEEQTLATWTDAAQNLARPYGKILRIDPSGANSPNGRYGIPADNPFVGQAGKLGEIWAYGFRNPHRFSWDTGGTGKMILTNIGEHNVESIYLGQAGANYGWNEREGPFLFKKSDADHVYPLPTDDATLGYTYPVAMYDHDEGQSIVGGFVYRGTGIPELRGNYVFGDIVNGRLFYAEESALTTAAPPNQQAPIYELKLVNAQGAPVTLLQLVAPSTRVDLRFGLDVAGELLLSDKQTGQIWRLTRVGGNATATPSPTTPTGTNTPIGHTPTPRTPPATLVPTTTPTDTHTATPVEMPTMATPTGPAETPMPLQTPTGAANTYLPWIMSAR